MKRISTPYSLLSYSVNVLTGLTELGVTSCHMFENVVIAVYLEVEHPANRTIVSKMLDIRILNFFPRPSAE